MERTDQFLRQHLQARRSAITTFSPQLLDSMEYSLFTGGKRFRPVLCLFTLRGLGHKADLGLPWASALEMVHTYSLIHDDLPCMDNDDFRRGQPTNHKKYGEALALLAGDALLTEAFLLLSKSMNQPALLPLLAHAIGASGMVGGQAMDMGHGPSLNAVGSLQTMHAAKTGALISAAVEGAGLIAQVDEDRLEVLRELGGLIGLAFQIKDDLLDMQTEDPRSYLHFLGIEGTKKELERVNARSQSLIDKLPSGCQPLHQFISANTLREK